MKSESSKSFKHGFTLNEQELRRLYDIMCQQIRSVTKDVGFTANFEMKFNNGVIANPISLDEILSQENIGSAAIRRISINLQGKENYSTYKISLQFLDPSKEESEDNKPIKYKVEGEDRDWVFVTSSLIDERISRIKTFRLSGSRVRELFLLLSFLLMWFVLIMTTSTAPALAKLTTIENQWNSKSISDLGQLIISVERLRIESQSVGNLFQNGNNIILLVIAVVIMGVTLSISEIISFLFPPYNFLWGDYMKYYETRKGRRNFILGVIVLGIVLSVVGDLIYGILPGR